MIKEYVALSNVGYAGRMYTSGEIFSADLTAEQEERLLRLNAVKIDCNHVDEPLVEVAVAAHTEKEQVMLDGTDGIVVPAKKRTRKKASA